MGRGQGGGGGGGSRLAGGGSIRTSGSAGGAALTEDERSAIFNYSNITYAGINDQLREGVEIHAGLKESLDRIDSGLAKLPDYRGTSYRVLTFDSEESAQAFASQFKAGQNASFREYLSTSRVRDASSFEFDDHTSSSNVRFTIKGKTGKDITKYANQPDQREVLFGRGSKFKVTSVTRHNGTVAGKFGEQRLYQTDITLEQL